MEELTDRQRKVLEFIKERINDSGLPPTLREIQSHFNLSSLASPRFHLKSLAKRGYIRLKSQISRGIELLSPATGIPVVGQISAGKALEAIEDIEGYLDLSKAFPDGKNLFCLKVKGDSMEGAGIIDGDLAIVRKRPDANSGEIVVALIQDEALIKRLKGKGKKFELVSENPKYPPVSAKNTQIIGKVIGVFRNYEPIPL